MNLILEFYSQWCQSTENTEGQKKWARMGKTVGGARECPIPLREIWSPGVFWSKSCILVHISQENVLLLRVMGQSYIHDPHF